MTWKSLDSARIWTVSSLTLDLTHLGAYEGTGYVPFDPSESDYVPYNSGTHTSVVTNPADPFGLNELSKKYGARESVDGLCA
jgi:hypothetical protein